MGDPAQQRAPHGDMDHGFGHVQPGFIIAHEPAPACHPAKGMFDHPTSRQYFEAWVFVGSAHDLQHEVSERGFVEQLGAVIGAIGEQVLEPGPALADGIKDGLCPGTVEMSAVVRLTISSRPSVSTAMWRLRPTIFLFAS